MSITETCFQDDDSPACYIINKYTEHKLINPATRDFACGDTNITEFPALKKG
jgi:hypothetical protein